MFTTGDAVTGVNNIISTVIFDEFNFTSLNLDVNKISLLQNATNDGDDLFKLLLDRSQLVLTSVGLLANSATVVTLIKNGEVSYVNCYYRPQTKFAKVMFLQVSVCPQGGGVHGMGDMHSRGHAWWGSVCSRGCACWGEGGVCAGGMCDGGTSVAGGCAWQGCVCGVGHVCHACPLADNMIYGQ